MRERYPTEDEQIQALNENFKRFRPGILHALQECMEEENYNVFSNSTSAGNNRGLHMSIESPHDRVHVSLGQGQNRSEWGDASGDMAHVETAGFDPIFFLHHSNVGMF